MSSPSEPIRSLSQASAWLEGLINHERDPAARSRARWDLTPIRALLDRLDAPQRALSVVHIAGSKGKGSTALLAESVLRALGERVGTFTSPHLESWTERFRIDGRPVAEAALAAAAERVRPHVEALRSADSGPVPTFFDATTAVALELFREAGLDRCVLEVGLGGRLDSTNAVDGAVACVTSIELEHTDKLGDHLAAIAAEKAGILKPDRPAVVGWLPDEALEVVCARAAEVGAPLWQAGRDFDVEVAPAGPAPDRAPELALRYRDRDGCGFEARLPALGRHHARNAALAVAAVRRLDAYAGHPETVAASAPAGLAAAELPGRVELLERRPWVVVDAAHTEASVRALAEALSTLPARRAHFVLSISSDKDADALLAALLPGAAHVTATRAEPRRSLDPRIVADAAARVSPGSDVRVVPDPREAVREARQAVGPDDLLCVTGSIYLAGIARAELRPSAADAGARTRGPAARSAASPEAR